MSSIDENYYKNMLASFRTSDLQALLTTFGCNKNGQKSELKDRAIDMLTKRPTSVNCQLFLSKIVEIYHSMQNQSDVSNNDLMMRTMLTQRQVMSLQGMQVQPQRMFLPPSSQYSQQQPQHITRAGLPQVMPQIQRGMYGGNTTGNNNFQFSYQVFIPRNVLSQAPINQHINMVAANPMYDTNSSSTGTNNTFIAHQSLINIRLKKLPFFQILSECIKPTVLFGSEKCTLSTASRGMREATFKLTMGPTQINYISENRDISYGKNEYICQCQIRICLLEAGSTEITDYMPLGLHIRIGNKLCSLPPTAPNTRPGTQARRIARPINCTQLLKLNPNLTNTISVNWCPDGQTYILAMYVVKKLTSDTLLKKLEEKSARSADETKNVIIKKLADVDPDLATTSYRVSLLCPLSKIRMKLPAKSVNCNHLQCFDVRTFILMNEKKPTWMCPTCNKPCLYDDIQIETYFLEIVTSPDLADCSEEIEILSDGTWRVIEKNNELKHVESSAHTKEKPIDSVNLDESDDNDTELNKEVNQGSKKECEKLKSNFIDLALSDDDENEATKKYKQENEAQAVDVVQPIFTTLDTTPQVQPQQAVTRSEQDVVIEIDSPSPPVTPTPTTTAS